MADGLTRRAVLGGLGAGAGLLLARGLGVGGWGRPQAASQPDILRELAASLTPHQRSLVVLPLDDPTRQITNTVSVIDRPHLGTLLSPRQLAIVERFAASMLSPRGQRDFAPTFAVEGRFEGCVLLLYGDPEVPGAQAHLMGGHLMLRGGGPSPEQAAFGGGIAYGHQEGNHRWQVEGNSFAPHGDAANRLFAALGPAERARAIQPEPPHELVLQPLGEAAGIPGLRIGGLGDEAREAARALVDTVLASYPEADRGEAWSCLEEQGGLDALHFSVYGARGYYEDMVAWNDLAAEERARRGDPYWQVWRVEGPGAVLHFKGWPHVHAYVSVVRDPGRIGIGEPLGETRRPIQGEEMRRLLEAAMRGATGEALAWNPPEVPGRFCAGPITSGLAYALDPYANELVVAEIRTEALAAPVRERLAAEGGIPEPGRTLRIASLGYYVSQERDFGAAEKVERSGVLMRDALVAHLRAGALSG